MSAARATPVQASFHGPPDSLEALVPAQPELVEQARLELTEFDLQGEVHCSDAGCGLWWAHARLPARTPAGTHVGRLHFGPDDAKGMEVEVVVHPHHEVTVSPTQLVVQVMPGQKTRHRFVVLNAGNTALVLARDDGFGLLREGGLEDALSAAYRSKASGLDRVALVADALADRHALVSVRVTDGPLAIEPEAYQRFEVTLRWPRNLEPGRVYDGTWHLAHQTLSVRASVLAPDKGATDADVPNHKRS